jgi:hypothetical protein
MLPPSESHDPASRSEIYGLATIAAQFTTDDHTTVSAFQNAVRDGNIKAGAAALR